MLCHLYLDKNASLSGLFMKIPSVEDEELYFERQKFWSTILMNKYSYLLDSIIQMALINFPCPGLCSTSVELHFLEGKTAFYCWL